MAIYHLSVKAVSRSAGRSATAAAAYRAADKIEDTRSGLTHDYTRKRGVVSSHIVLPSGAPAWATDRAALWNAAELAEKRKDACVAREFEAALPAELPAPERERLVMDFAQEMADAEGCAVDFSLHAPDPEGDKRNWHAHMLRTTRQVGADGLTEKLDTEKAGRDRKADLAAARARWAELVNERLLENGIDARVDHRSLADQGIERTPTEHLGPAATGIERRTDKPSLRSEWIEQRNAEIRLQQAAEAGALEREASTLDSGILAVETDLRAALAEREATQAKEKQMVDTVRGLDRALEQPDQIPAPVLQQAEKRLTGYLQSLGVDPLVRIRMERLRQQIRNEQAARQARELAERERANQAAQQTAQQAARQRWEQIGRKALIVSARALQDADSVLGRDLRAELAERMRIVPRSLQDSPEALALRDKAGGDWLLETMLREGLIDDAEALKLGLEPSAVERIDELVDRTPGHAKEAVQDFEAANFAAAAQDKARFEAISKAYSEGFAAACAAQAANPDAGFDSTAVYKHVAAVASKINLNPPPAAAAAAKGSENTAKAAPQADSKPAAPKPAAPKP